MKTSDVMSALKKLGSAQTKKTYLRHGCPEPFFGVKIADMKALIKKLKIQNTVIPEELRKWAGTFCVLLPHGRDE